MNVLFVIENYLPHIGGVEIVFKNLAEGLVRKGHHVTIVTHRLKNTPAYEELNGVKIHRVNCFHSRYVFTFFSIPQVLAEARQGSLLKEGLTIVIAGRPNAGKSSLFNALLMEKRAMVSEVPGTTRDSVDVRFEMDGKQFLAIDTAGVRKKKQVDRNL